MKFLDGMLAFEHGLEGGDRVFTRFVCIGVAQGVLEGSRNGELENYLFWRVGS